MQLNPTQDRIKTFSRVYSPAESLTLQRRQSAFRLAVGWFLAILSLVEVYAVAWDVQWHAEFGRDSLWSAPHDFIYGGIALTGIVALLVVLYETYQKYRGNPAVTASNSIGFLGIFYAPAGFYLIGFSMLSNVLAAPLDNYWHELYGIDVTIWAPFHSMAIVGSLFAHLGVLLVFASEYNRHRNRRRLGQIDRFEKGLGLAALLGLVIAATGVFSIAMLLVNPANQPFTLVFKLWGWEPSIYNTLLALLIPFIFIGLVLGTGRPGVATFSAILITLFRLIMLGTVQVLTETTATAEGLTKLNRPSDRFVSLGVLVPDSFPVYTILYGVLIDLAFVGMIWLWGRRNKVSEWGRLLSNFGLTQQSDLLKWLLNPWRLTGLAVFVSLLMALLDRPYLRLANQIQNLISQPQVMAVAGARLKDFVYPELLPTLPLVILAGVAAGFLSRYFVILLRYQDK